jgi:hypothetical protein
MSPSTCSLVAVIAAIVPAEAARADVGVTLVDRFFLCEAADIGLTDGFSDA